MWNQTLYQLQKLEKILEAEQQASAALGPKSSSSTKSRVKVTVS